MLRATCFAVGSMQPLRAKGRESAASKLGRIGHWHTAVPLIRSPIPKAARGWQSECYMLRRSVRAETCKLRDNGIFRARVTNTARILKASWWIYTGRTSYIRLTSSGAKAELAPQFRTVG